jgi:hypothetical protein
METMPGASTMPDQTVAFDMLKESECIQEHFRITDLLVDRGWAHSYEVKQQFNE